MIAQKSKLRLTQLHLHPKVETTASQPLFHQSGIPIWICCGWIPLATRLCAFHNGNPVLVHRQRGTKVFHQALQDRRLLAIPDIHYFDAHRLRAHRLRAHLLQAPELQLNPRTSNITGPEGVGTQSDPSSDAETDAEAFFLARARCLSAGLRS